MVEGMQEQKEGNDGCGEGDIPVMERSMDDGLL